MSALALLSGGLDSVLAARLVAAQGVNVTAVSFTGPFFPESRRQGESTVEKAARRLGVELVLLPKDDAFVELVRRPRHGWGRGLNPCVDCRIYMLRRAAELMPRYRAELLVTGEVLGQRPLSQHRQALHLVERESGLSGRLLRPLSARLLEPTEAEKAGRIDRGRLLSIRGRSRQVQLELARREGIETFEPAAGGCLLADEAVAARLRDLFRCQQRSSLAEAALCTCGKHFRLHADLKVVLGRNLQENERLLRLAPQLPRAELLGPPGPTVLLCGRPSPGDADSIARLIRAHAPKAQGTVAVEIVYPDRRELITSDRPATPEEIAAWRIEPGKAAGRGGME